MRGRLKYFAAAFFAAVLWGLMAIPLRAIREWPAEDILYYRIFVSTALIWPFIFLFRHKKLSASIHYLQMETAAQRKKLVTLTVIASLLIMGNWFAFIYAVNHVSIQSAAFAYLVCPLLTTLAAFLLLNERLTGLKKIAIGIALVSVALLARGSLHDVAWSVGIASFYALYLVVQRIIQHVDRLVVLAVQLAICTLLILPFLLWQHHPLPTSTTFWFNIATIAIFFTIIPLYMSLYALNGISSTTVGILISVHPFMCLVIAVVYLHEHVYTHHLLAYVFCFSAVVLSSWRSPRKRFHRGG